MNKAKRSFADISAQQVGRIPFQDNVSRPVHRNGSGYRRERDDPLFAGDKLKGLRRRRIFGGRHIVCTHQRYLLHRLRAPPLRHQIRLIHINRSCINGLIIDKRSVNDAGTGQFNHTIHPVLAQRPVVEADGPVIAVEDRLEALIRAAAGLQHIFPRNLEAVSLASRGDMTPGIQVHSQAGRERHSCYPVVERQSSIFINHHLRIRGSEKYKRETNIHNEAVIQVIIGEGRFVHSREVLPLGRYILHNVRPCGLTNVGNGIIQRHVSAVGDRQYRIGRHKPGRPAEREFGGCTQVIRWKINNHGHFHRERLRGSRTQVPLYIRREIIGGGHVLLRRIDRKRQRYRASGRNLTACQIIADPGFWKQLNTIHRDLPGNMINRIIKDPFIFQTDKTGIPCTRFIKIPNSSICLQQRLKFLTGIVPPGNTQPAVPLLVANGGRINILRVCKRNQGCGSLTAHRSQHNAAMLKNGKLGIDHFPAKQPEIEPNRHGITDKILPGLNSSPHNSAPCTGIVPAAECRCCREYIPPALVYLSHQIFLGESFRSHMELTLLIPVVGQDNRRRVGLARSHMDLHGIGRNRWKRPGNYIDCKRRDPFPVCRGANHIEGLQSIRYILGTAEFIGDRERLTDR